MKFDVFSESLDVKAAIIPGFNVIGSSGSDKINKSLVHLIYRKPILQVYDNYLNSAQYLGVPKKKGKKNTLDTDFKPAIVLPIPMITARLYKSHIVSEESRLNFFVEDQDLQEKADNLIEDIQLWSVLDSVLPSFFANGSMFLYFQKMSNGSVRLKFFNTKYCFPEFDNEGELKSVIVRYIYETAEIDPTTKKHYWRWFQFKFNKFTDFEYDNPIFDKSQTNLPEFKLKNKISHNYGYVAGEWIKTTHCFDSDDGESFLEGKTTTLDRLNFLFSGIYTASLANMFPPLFSNAFDLRSFIREANQRDRFVSEGNELITTMNQHARMTYVEPALTGVQNGMGTNQELLQYIQYMFSTVLLNPEAVAPHANSGRALEALYKPVVQYVKCRRPLLKKALCNLLEKIEPLTDLPAGTFGNAKKEWGSVFSDTIDDVSKKVSNLTQLFSSGLISESSAVEYIGKTFGIKNVEDELKKIEQERKKKREEDVEDRNLMQTMSDPQGQR